MISSMGNGRIKRIVLLQEKSRQRAKENVFIAEGIKMFEEAPAETIRELYVDEKLSGDVRFRALSAKIESCRRKGVVVETVTGDVFRKMSDTKSPQGILCIVECIAHDEKEMIQRALARQKQERRPPLFLLLEDVQDPGNLGTIIRTAEGAGADGIFMTRGTVDIYNPKTIRSTMGSLFRVPFCYVDSLQEVIALLQKNGIQVYAAHLNGQQYFHHIDYSGGSAFLIGNEGNGLKEETVKMADCCIRIPMEGKLESLNAAVAAALLMYQSRLST